MPPKESAFLRSALLALLACAAAAVAHGQSINCICESAVYVDPSSGEYTAYTSMQWDVDDPEDWYGTLAGSFTSAGMQSAEGDGYVEGELDWAGNVALGTSYEIDGDAILEFDFDICGCYYEVPSSDNYVVPSAPAISLQYLYLVSPPTEEASWSVSSPVLAGCYVTENDGVPTYLSDCTAPSYTFDETATAAGVNTFTFTGQMYGWNVNGDPFSVTRTDGSPSTQGNAFANFISGSGQCGIECAAVFSTYVLAYSAVESYSTFQVGPGSYLPTTYSTSGAGGAQIIVPQTPPDPLFAVGGTNTLSNGWYAGMIQQSTLPADAVSVSNTWLIALEGDGDSGSVYVSLLIDGGAGLASSWDTLTIALP